MKKYIKHKNVFDIVTYWLWKHYVYCIKYFRLLSSEVNRFQYQHFCLGLHFKEKNQMATNPSYCFITNHGYCHWESLCYGMLCSYWKQPFCRIYYAITGCEKIKIFSFILDIIWMILFTKYGFPLLNKYI